jgi:hypothetical protein
MPGSLTPADRLRPAMAQRTRFCLPPNERRRVRDLNLSRFNPPACKPPVYASQSGSPPPHATLGSGWRLAFTGAGLAPAGSNKRFQVFGFCLHIVPLLQACSWRTRSRCFCQARGDSSAYGGKLGARYVWHLVRAKTLVLGRPGTHAGSTGASRYLGDGSGRSRRRGAAERGVVSVQARLTSHLRLVRRNAADFGLAAAPMSDADLRERLTPEASHH